MSRIGRPPLPPERRLSRTLGTSLKPETEALLRKRMAETGESMSTVIRQAVEAGLLTSCSEHPSKAP